MDSDIGHDDGDAFHIFINNNNNTLNIKNKYKY